MDAAQPAARQEALAHQDNVARLRVGENVVAYIISVSVLQAA